MSGGGGSWEGRETNTHTPGSHGSSIKVQLTRIQRHLHSLRHCTWCLHNTDTKSLSWEAGTWNEATTIIAGFSKASLPGTKLTLVCSGHYQWLGAKFPIYIVFVFIVAHTFFTAPGTACAERERAREWCHSDIMFTRFVPLYTRALLVLPPSTCCELDRL